MTYDYFCKECNHQFERQLPMDDRKIPEDEPCPECGAMSVKQMVCAPAIVSDYMDVHTRAKKVGGEAFVERMRAIKKSTGRAPNSVPDF